VAKPELRERLARAARPLVERRGAELVDVELRGNPGSRVVRIYVDRVGGISLNECAAISRDISDRFDIEDMIDGSYRLEVSSPGVTRPLTTLADFQRAVGRRVRILVRGEGDQRFGRGEVIGTLLSADRESIRIRFPTGETAELPFDQVERAVPVVDFGSRREPRSRD
jgi:ribosome maturation factor RimP